MCLGVHYCEGSYPEPEALMAELGISSCLAVLKGYEPKYQCTLVRTALERNRVSVSLAWRFGGRNPEPGTKPDEGISGGEQGGYRGSWGIRQGEPEEPCFPISHARISPSPFWNVKDGFNMLPPFPSFFSFMRRACPHPALCLEFHIGVP